jgi:hypothetical protein
LRSGKRLEKSLSEIATRSIASDLVRFVPLEALLSISPPDYVYASGRPNRCNPRGVRCIYFSEDERTAAEELRRGYSDFLDSEQPRVAFTGRANLARVIDLGNPSVADALGISEPDLYGDWQFASSLTPLQQVGR